MNKSLKILLSVLSAVLIFVTFAVCSFAYTVDTSYDNTHNLDIMPKVMAHNNANRTTLPFDQNSVNGSYFGVLSKGGNVNSSVRMIAYTSDRYYHGTQFTDTGCLTYSMMSATPFSFTIDFGNVVDNLLYITNLKGIDRNYDARHHLQISVEIGGSTSSNGDFPDGSYQYLEDGSFSISCNYTTVGHDGTLYPRSNEIELLGDDTTTRSDYCYPLYSGPLILPSYADNPYEFPPQVINTVQGKLQHNDGISFYYVKVHISTNHYNNAGGTCYYLPALAQPSVSYNSFELNTLWNSVLSKSLFGFGNEASYNEGYNVGYDVGYDDGYDSGELTGYDSGYNVGYEDGAEAVGFLDWILVSVGGFLSFEIAPGLSFGLLLGAIVGLGSFIFFLKVFAGG